MLTGLTIAPAAGQVAPAGFYVRGEAGLTSRQNTSFGDTNTTAASCLFCDFMVVGSMNTGALVGGGVGMRLTPNFRTELSVDYMTSVKVSGRNDASPPSSLSANTDSVVVLLNGYVDFPELAPQLFGPLVPYVDAGFGLASNMLGSVTGTSGSYGAYNLSGATRTSFAYAVGLGFAYPLSPNLTADVGYRFYDNGPIYSGTSLSAHGSSAQVPGLKSGSADAHTITIGLRFGFP